jgi:hypothetical protein
MMLASCFLTAGVALAGCGSASSEQAEAEPAPNTLSAAEQADGWELLFDGTSFQGWRGLDMREVPQGHWVIEEGTIRKVANDLVPPSPTGDAVPRADLVTEDTFEDFELAWEWRISPQGNSGLKYNVDERMATGRNPGHAIGFEYQLIDGGGRNPPGSLYDLIPPADSSAARPVGEWNQSPILVRGDQVEH